VALELAVSGNAASWSSTEVDAGYYTLILQLRNEGDPVWGRAEAVRVLAGQTVAASYPLTDADINASSTGGLVLRIQAALMSPFEITLGGLQPSLPLQSEMTVTAHADPAPDSWQWYLNGNPVTGEAREAITVGAALAPGHYWLDVVARRGGVLSSAHAFFTVSSQLAAAAPSVGEAVINEIMIDPAGVADTSGEWFEITNAAGKPLDIEGLVLRTASQFVRIAASGTGVILAPGAFFVFCRNGDPAGNGGVGADYVWTGISLPNSGGSLAIAGFGTNGMDGTVIDAVQWTSAVAGKALALRTANRNAVDNDVAANWYWSSTPYSASDMGTPGATNEQ
jgi:hypothetical protein